MKQVLLQVTSVLRQGVGLILPVQIRVHIAFSGVDTPKRKVIAVPVMKI